MSRLKIMIGSFTEIIQKLFYITDEELPEIKNLTLYGKFVKTQNVGRIHQIQ